MPPKKAANAQAGAPKATPPFDGCTIALSGTFHKSHATIEEIVTSLGGQFVKSVTQNVTHLVSIQRSVDQLGYKVNLALTRSVPILDLQWLLECDSKKARLPEGPYHLKPGGTGPSLPATAATAATAPPVVTPVPPPVLPPVASVAVAAVAQPPPPLLKQPNQATGNQQTPVPGPIILPAPPSVVPVAAAKTNGVANAKAAASPLPTRTRKRANTTANTNNKNDDDAADGDGSSNRPSKKKQKADPAGTGKQPDDTDGAKAKDDKADVKTTLALPQKPVLPKDLHVPVDQGCHIPNAVIHIDDDCVIFDASLNQANTSSNNNKFYRIQVVRNTKGKTYHTWTRWGRVGEMGQTAVLGDGSLEAAVKHFEKKFRDKTGLAWADRAKDPKMGKYAFIERSYDPDSEDDAGADKKAKKTGSASSDEEEEPPSPPQPSQLQPEVQSLMQLIFNQQYFQATMSQLNYDAKKLPLGKLSKLTISRGFQTLKDLSELIRDPSLANTRWSMPFRLAREHLSNMFYTLIPHDFGRNRPPVIQSLDMLKVEVELLESLSDMKAAADIMKSHGSGKNQDPVHPIDRQFQGLGLSEMTVLDRASTEFRHLAQYLDVTRGYTHGLSYRVDAIFRIEREGEFDRMDKADFGNARTGNRRLLWHGSRCTNFGGILSQGLRIAPPEAPVSGYMFGKGIYLADMSSKSANYCVSSMSNGDALLLLCEAELGWPMQELFHANAQAGETAKQHNMLATWGRGRMGPTSWIDAECVHSSLKGVLMPNFRITPGSTGDNNTSLHYNEYICYDVSQVRMRYLLRVHIGRA